MTWIWDLHWSLSSSLSAVDNSLVVLTWTTSTLLHGNIKYILTISTNKSVHKNFYCLPVFWFSNPEYFGIGFFISSHFQSGSFCIANPEHTFLLGYFKQECYLGGHQVSVSCIAFQFHYLVYFRSSLLLWNKNRLFILCHC